MMNDSRSISCVSEAMQRRIRFHLTHSGDLGRWKGDRQSKVLDAFTVACEMIEYIGRRVEYTLPVLLLSTRHRSLIDVVNDFQ
jgi:hypothetical protein